MGLLVWLQVKWPVPWEVSKHNISSLTPRGEDKISCRKGGKILCQEMMHFSKYLAALQRRGGKLHCLKAARLNCTDAKQPANPLLRGLPCAGANPTSQFATKTQEKSAQSTSLAGKPAPSLPSKILQLRDFPQVLDVIKLEIKDWGSSRMTKWSLGWLLWW